MTLPLTILSEMIASVYLTLIPLIPLIFIGALNFEWQNCIQLKF